MIRISTRIWAILFALFALPVGAIASDSAAAAANKANDTESATTETTVTGRTQAATTSASADPLLRLLVNKGVLNASEVNAISTAPASEGRQRLLSILKDKGIISAADLETLNTTVTTAAPGEQRSPSHPEHRSHHHGYPSAEWSAAASQDPASRRPHPGHCAHPGHAAGSFKTRRLYSRH